jgi:hypothetical protein
VKFQEPVPALTSRPLNDNSILSADTLGNCSWINQSTPTNNSYSETCLVSSQGVLPLYVYTPTSTNDGLANQIFFQAKIKIDNYSVGIDLNPNNAVNYIIGLDDSGSLTDNSNYMRCATSNDIPMSLWPSNYANKDHLIFTKPLAEDFLFSISPTQVTNIDFSQSTQFIGINGSVTFVLFRGSNVDLTFEIICFINFPKTMVGVPGITLGPLETYNIFQGTYQNNFLSTNAGSDMVSSSSNNISQFVYNSCFNASLKYLRIMPPQQGIYNQFNSDLPFGLPSINCSLI